MLTNLAKWIREAWYFTITFFPVKLFLLHLRRSHILIIFWVLLFLFVNRALGVNYGFPYLFLTPEYLDKVGFFSYFMVGITAGLFIMAFHLSSYIYYSYRFTFLATLSRPLWKFCINNSIIPTVFIITYIGQIIHLLLDEGYEWPVILINTGGLLAGTITTIVFSLTYFISTIRTLELPDSQGKERNPLKPFKALVRKEKDLKKDYLTNQDKVHYYLKNFVQVRVTRTASHYQKEKLLETIQQHHFAASIYFVVLIVLVIALSFASGNRHLMIPAGATVFLIFALYLMITGVLYTRFKTWTLTIGIVIILVLNYFSGKPWFSAINYAYGLDYTEEPVGYNYHELAEITTDSILALDKYNALRSLENWREKFKGKENPKLVILNVSGGGLRSTLWTMKVLQETDSLTRGKLMKHIHLITGSSGGMLGAAYFRELIYRSKTRQLNDSPYSEKFLYNAAKDALNPVTFTLAVNDLFLRLKSVEYAGRTYPVDRGWAFDQKINDNTGGVLNRSFGYYKYLEFESQVPTLILGPTIVGDGRKLLMNPQGFSFLTFTRPYEGLLKTREYDAVEYSRLFANHQPDKLSFLTALRLSASFPYITPLVNLPSKPSIELIDAGVRDNEGLEIGLRYLYEFKDWIKANTAGVIIVQIKANRPDEIPIDEDEDSRLDDLIRPIGGVVQSFHNLQIYNKSLLMQWSNDIFDFPVELIKFSLFEKQDEVSLSWHLTEKEKRRIIRTFESEMNQKALKDLRVHIK